MPVQTKINFIDMGNFGLVSRLSRSPKIYNPFLAGVAIVKYCDLYASTLVTAGYC